MAGQQAGDTGTRSLWFNPPDDGRAGQRAQFEEALVRPLRRTARPAPRPPWWPGAGGDGRELPGLRQDEDARPCAAFPWSSSCTA